MSNDRYVVKRYRYDPINGVYEPQGEVTTNSKTEAERLQRVFRAEDGCWPDVVDTRSGEVT